MSAPIKPDRLTNLLRLLAQSAAESWWLYQLEIPDVVDPLQDFAAGSGLIDLIGQDAVQSIMTGPFAEVRKRPRPKPNPLQSEPEPEPAIGSYSTSQTVVNAFWHIARTQSTEHLTKWLADHPLDAPHLRKLWKQKSVAA